MDVVQVLFWVTVDSIYTGQFSRPPWMKSDYRSTRRGLRKKGRRRFRVRKEIAKNHKNVALTNKIQKKKPREFLHK